ncbi:hypothetical protein M747DRAFT_319362 [Aspergillus niger ATCC 13496]|uniref:Uncharacterized protein n=3 Tax=Aspergillus niger TaxID=5061 RepID=A2QZU7_ASPNC|nr:hypothetical protein An12g06230 [Aspergillus niger]RDH14583.1 hypothetical protein M747DRAFT_319362 [Aspergillus niger ATCC 13496]CAK41159.1 hypothetical protein An12g06230 [Aspergillus niger]
MRVTDEEKQQGVESVVLCASAWRVKEGEVVVNSQGLWSGRKYVARATSGSLSQSSPRLGYPQGVVTGWPTALFSDSRKTTSGAIFITPNRNWSHDDCRRVNVFCS